MNADIVITKATAEDSEGITNVFYKAWLKSYPNEKVGVTVEDVEYIYKDEFNSETIQKRKEVYKIDNPNVLRLVAKKKDIVVGVLTIEKKEAYNQLRTIYVLPDFQNRGIGLMLWNNGKGFLDKEKDTIVQVVDYNEQAILFYKKIGFVDTEKRFQEEKWRMKSGAIFTEIEMKLDKSLL